MDLKRSHKHSPLLEAERGNEKICWYKPLESLVVSRPSSILSIRFNRDTGSVEAEEFGVFEAKVRYDRLKAEGWKIIESWGICVTIDMARQDAYVLKDCFDVVIYDGWKQEYRVLSGLTPKDLMEKFGLGPDAPDRLRNLDVGRTMSAAELGLYHRYGMVGLRVKKTSGFPEWYPGTYVALQAEEEEDNSMSDFCSPGN